MLNAAKPDTLHSPEDLDRMAAALEASGDYKILRRLVPRTPSPPREGETGKTGIILDTETTGLDPSRDEVIELAMVKFRYSDADAITGVTEIFQAFNEPSAPIPPAITELTGITDAMVAGHKIDAAAVDAFVADASIVIAHNAKFDRPFAEKAWPVFAQRHWACSVAEIEWPKYGFGGGKLGYLLADMGYFHEAHRAIDDCQALSGNSLATAPRHLRHRLGGSVGARAAKDGPHPRRALSLRPEGQAEGPRLSLERWYGRTAEGLVYRRRRGPA